jgi:alpha-methylacyl-CoA racemase
LLRERLTAAFLTRTREEWAQLFAGLDACVAPVLTMTEAAAHPHNAARGTFVEVGGVLQPAPAPRFDRTPAGAPSPPVGAGAHTGEMLARFGFTEAEAAVLRSAGVLG